jgi:signal transduction histidine kinase
MREPHDEGLEKNRARASETVGVSTVVLPTRAADTGAPSTRRQQHGHWAMLRAPFAGRTWRANLYSLVGALLAVPGFLLVVASTVLGLGLAVTFLGLPLLAFGGVAAIRLGGLHRGLAAGILGQEVTGARTRPPGRGLFGWLQARLADPAAWRARLYLVVKLPLALVTLYAVVVLYVEGVLLALYPLWWSLAPSSPPTARSAGILDLGAVIGRGSSNSLASPSAHQLTLHVGGIYLDTWPLVTCTCLVGIVALFVVPWVSRGAARLDVVIMGHLLGPSRGSLRVERLEAARSVVAEDAAATLRRIERDLHDGTQAQLVALAISLGAARERLEDQPVAGRDCVMLEFVAAAHDQAKDALDELRSIARGIHPPALDVGLEAAIETLTARSAVPATLYVALDSRPTDAIGTIAYYAVAELLTNVAKHADAVSATVEVTEDAGVLIVTVTDDGHGGADPARGTGLNGLASRLDAVDGHLVVDSPPGGPTAVTVQLPVRI